MNYDVHERVCTQIVQYASEGEFTLPLIDNFASKLENDDMLNYYIEQFNFKITVGI